MVGSNNNNCFTIVNGLLASKANSVRDKTDGSYGDPRSQLLSHTRRNETLDQPAVDPSSLGRDMF